MIGKKKKIIVLSVMISVFAAMIIWVLWGNTALELNSCTVSGSKLPKSFEGYRIAHISDLHNAQIGDENEKLLTMLRDAKPDMIAITGDLIDSYHTDVKIALRFIQEAVKIAPCYYAPGNHEARLSEYQELKSGMYDAGVVILENAKTTVTLSGEAVTVIGLRDPDFITNTIKADPKEVIREALSQLCQEEDGFTIVLSHRPEHFDIYADYELDLVLTGHAHGGQFRLPFVGGLYAPHQGLLPAYDTGLHTKENTNMIVSRGIGNSIFPVRFNNRPEVVLIELNKVTER